MALSDEDIKQLISILQKGLGSEVPEQKVPQKSKSKKTNKKTSTSSVMKTKSVKINTSEYNENKFLTMGVKDLHKDDAEIDKALKKFPPTPRLRKFKPINVVCRSCGKKESISPTLLHDSADRYKCNKCSGSAG
jgi:lysyl-tRNA synthetase class I